MPKLELTGLSKQHQDFLAVSNLGLQVQQGEFLTLLGPSGSGKTTTLMMIAGFLAPTAGDIRIDGQSVVALPPEKRNLGVVFQDYALFPHLSVAENISFPLRMRGVTGSGVRSKVDWALELVRLPGLGSRLPRQLSGGQQQRVALARAIVFEPAVLLMDEPLGALDKNLRESMKEEIKRLHKQVGTTIVYVTHDQEEALAMSDRIALMNRGQIEQLGAPADLYERPRNRFVAEFIGDTNIVPGFLQRTASAAPGHAAELEFVAGDNVRFGVSAQALANSQLAQGPAERLLVLRPERLEIAARNPARESPNSGIVVGVTYVGDLTRYQVQVTDSVVLTVARHNSTKAYRPAQGEAVHVSCSPEDVYVI